MKVVYKVNGREVSEDEFRNLPPKDEEWLHNPPNIESSWMDHVSWSVACHRKDVKQRNEELRKRGITDCHYTESGRVQFDSRRAMKRFCKTFGYVNYDET